MDQKSLQLLIYVMAGLFALLVAVAVIRVKKNKAREDIWVEKKKGNKNYLIFIYRFYQNVPLFRKFFSKIKQQVEITYPADAVSVNKAVTNILAKVTAIAVLGVILSFAIGNGDVYFILSGFVITYILCDITVNKKLKKESNKLLKQFAEALTILSHYYHEQPMIEDAIYKTMLDVPYEISLHLNKIYEIVDSPDIEKELNEYIGHEPNKFVLMFLSLCSTVKDFGDKKMEDGQSLFVRDLNYLQKELNDELLRQRRNEDAFVSLSGISLLPLIFVKPAQAFGESLGIKDYYNSVIGITVMVGMFVFTIAINRIIIFLRDGDDEAEEKDTDIFTTISDRLPLPLQVIITKIVNKNYTKYKKYDAQERGLGVHTGPRAFLVKQLTIAIVTTLLMTAFFAAGSHTLRRSALRNFEDEFSSIATPSEEYTESMKAVAEDYVKLKKADTLIDENILAEEIAANTSITSDMYAREVAKVIAERVTKYQNTYFKWYLLLIAFGLGVLGFYFPVLYLKLKYSVIDMRKEEEVVRFQSLMLILMHMGGMTTEVILEWMYKFSYCFKESINTCMINSAAGINQAIEEMKNEEYFTPFRNFCDNLLLIDKVGVESAFEEIEVSRENFLENRNITSQQNIRNRSSVATLLAFVPVGLLVIFFIVVPMVMFAAQLMSEYQTLISH